MTTHYYLSFARPDKFLGGCIIPATCDLDAFANSRNLNPGGEMVAVPIPPEQLHKFPVEFHGKLLDEKTMREMFDGVSQGELDDSGREIPEEAVVFCEECNEL